MKNDVEREGPLLNALYELALDPLLFEEFTIAWIQFVRDTQTEESFTVDESTLQHFERAFSIMEKMGRDLRSEETLDQVVRERDGPCLAIDIKANVLFANSTIEDVLEKNLSGKSLLKLVHKKSLPSLESGLKKAVEQQQLVPVLVLLESNLPSLFVLRPTSDSENLIVDITGSVWSEQVSEFLRQSHGLTKSELVVAALLYQGLNLREIADQQSRSKETIRTHLSSLLAKTGCRSQAQLMKLITGINFSREQSATPQWFEGRYQSFLLRLQDGRDLSYYEVGGPDLPVVVVMHPFMRTPELPPTIETRILACGYRIIGITRAGFGDSSRRPNKRDALEVAALDLEELLDQKSIEQVVMLGLMGGAVHCYQAAKMLPSRIKRVISIAGSLPLVDESQITSMPLGSTRALAYTARKLPRLLPLLVRSGVALVDTGDTDKLIKSLYRNSPADLACAMQPEVRDWIARGCRFGVYHGYETYASEMASGAGFRVGLHEAIQCPVHLIHSEQDYYTSFESVQAFAKQNPLYNIITIEDSGHLMLYMTPEAVADEISKLLLEEKRRPKAV